MLNKWIGDLKETPARIAERRQALGQRFREARDDGQERIWRAQTSTLEAMDHALDRTPEVPVVSRIAGAAGRLVQRGLDTLTDVGIPEYDDLNAKSAIRAVQALEGRVALLKLQRHEEARKNRKTVLRAIASRLAPAAA